MKYKKGKSESFNRNGFLKEDSTEQLRNFKEQKTIVGLIRLTIFYCIPVERFPRTNPPDPIQGGGLVHRNK